MSFVNVYYRPGDGEIHSWDNGSPVEKPGCVVSVIVVPDVSAFSPNPATHRIDPQTGEIVDKTPLERQIAARPTMDEIKSARASALAASDAMMMPDRELSEDTIEAWKAYRKALRDLTKDENGAPRSAMEMFEAFPLAPNGTDTVWWLRRRMELA